MEIAAKRPETWLIAATSCLCVLAVSVFLWIRLGSARYPSPDSNSYTAIFSWDGTLRSITITNDKTGKEERNKEIRAMIISEARKTLPKFIADMGLRRAIGKLPCGLEGAKELYRITCGLGERDAEEYDPDAKTPLMVAARNGDESKIEELIHSGADVNARDQHGITALMHSATLEDTKVLKRLISAGASLNTQESRGRTPLRIAVDAENIAGVKMLIASGADPDLADMKGWTPLMDATTPEMARALIAGGADKNAADKDGETPVMIATQFGSLDLLRALLKAQANVRARSKSGSTALELAKAAGNTEAAALLQKAEQASVSKQ